jgi:hypothetical protein
MAQRSVIRATPATLLATLLATMLAVLAGGCGTAATQSPGSRSSTTASGPARTIAASPATTTATTLPSTSASTSTLPPLPPGLPASIPGGTAPPGFVRYNADGFSFLAPSGLKPAPNGGVSGLPGGVSVKFLTHGGDALQLTNTQIIEGFNPKLHFDIDQVATNLRASDSNDPALTHVQTNVSAITVANAAGARIVSESYDTSGPNPVAFKRVWLMVTPRPGVLMDLVVVVEPGRGGTLNPATVLGSLRLDV